MSARALALAGILSLLLLQWQWHAVMTPPTNVSPWVLAAFYCMPLLPSLLLLALRHRAALLAGGIGALLYFCHGIMFLMGVPALRTPALIEVVLSVLVILASSWNGLRARFAHKPVASEKASE
jgi:uncharacterized membrane protein